MTYFNASTMYLFLFLFQPTNAQIYIQHIVLYNVHSYMFQYLCHPQGVFTFVPR